MTGAERPRRPASSDRDRTATNAAMSQGGHDVLIIGAGPAGSTLALLLARAGLDVLLVDRAAFPRAKPCGDCLSAEAARLLLRLGLLPAVQELQPATLLGWRIFGPAGACFSAAFRDLGDADPVVHGALAVPRRELDAALLNAAADAGARVLTGWVAIDLVRDGRWVKGVLLRDPQGVRREVRALLTVGADGLRSRVARRLGAVARPARIRKLSLTTHITRPGGGDWFGEMHVGDGVCAGLAPVGANGRCWNLTVVADADRFGRLATRPRAFFGAMLGRLPMLAGRGLEPAELLASGPFDAPIRRVTFPGAVLVGDAAGYFDPFTGQGIYHAMAGAERLAEVLVGCFRLAPGIPPGVRELQPYASAHASLTRGPRRVQRLIHHVLDRPPLAELAVAGLARRPRAAAALLAVTGDLRPAASLLSPRLAVSLLFPRPAPRPG